MGSNPIKSYPKEESPKIMMDAGKITEGINKVIQKLDRSFSIIAPITKLIMKPGPLIQLQPQYDQKANRVTSQKSCRPIDLTRKAHKRSLIIAKNPFRMN